MKTAGSEARVSSKNVGTLQMDNTKPYPRAFQHVKGIKSWLKHVIERVCE